MSVRRGISEIIASLIVLLIVSLLGTFLYSYTLTISQIQQETIINESNQATGKALERIRIIGVWYRETDELVNLTYLNYGENVATITAIYINGIPVNEYYVGINIEFSKQELNNVVFRSPVDLTSGFVYEVTTVSCRGLTYKYEWRS